MNHIFTTEDWAQTLPNCTAANLRRSATDASALEAVFSDYEAAGLRWRDSVTLLHKGAVLFHGQVTAVAPSGTGRAYTTRVTVQDMLWQLSRLTLGEQLADLKSASSSTASGKGVASSLKSSGKAAMSSFQRVAESCASTAKGWSTKGSGISVAVADSLPSIGRAVKRDGAVSQWTALHAMQQANPGSIFSPNYETGEVIVGNVFDGEAIVWNTADVPLLSVSLEPRWEDVVTGVAVAVSWQGESSSGTSVVRYPSTVRTEDEGVRVFTASASTPSQAAAQAAHVAAQIQHYYGAASRVQNNGSITVRADNMAGSLVGKRLVLEGEGTSPLWAEGENIIAEENWNLLTGTVALSVGLPMSDPTFDELNFPEKISGGGGGGGGGDGGGGGGDDPDNPDDDSTESSTSPGTTNDKPKPPQEEALTLTITKVWHEWDAAVGKHLCSVEWEVNKPALFEVSFDDGGFLDHGGGTLDTMIGRWNQYISGGEHTLVVVAKDGSELVSRTVPLNMGSSGGDTPSQPDKPTTQEFTVSIVAVEPKDNGDGTFTATVHWAASRPATEGGCSWDGSPYHSSVGNGAGSSGSYTIPGLPYGSHPISISSTDGTSWAYDNADVNYTGKTTNPDNPDGKTDEPDKTDDCTKCDARFKELEARLKKLEDAGACDCAERLTALITDAVDKALASVQVAVSAEGVLENACLGHIEFNTSGKYTGT